MQRRCPVACDKTGHFSLGDQMANHNTLAPSVDWKERHAHTKHNPGDFDCYAEAMDDEPIFVLMARDVQAPAIVREWARYRKMQILQGHKPESDMPKVHEALDCAVAMEDWRRDNDGKWRTAPLLDQLNIGKVDLSTVVDTRNYDPDNSDQRPSSSGPMQNGDFQHWDDIKAIAKPDRF